MAISFILFVRRLVLGLALCSLFSVTAFAASQADPLDEKAFQEFISNYKQDPSAISANPDIMRKLSPQQMEKVVETLKTTHFTYICPVEIKGEDFGGFQGKELQRLSLMAIRGEKLVPIPFQFDEYDERGLIYIKECKINDPEGKPGILDESDELAFMFRDAGLNRYESEMGLSEGSVLGEIVLNAPGNATRYAYLVEGNSERSSADYVQTDLKNGTIETTFMKMVFNPKNYTDVKEVSFKTGPNAGNNVIDSAYVRLSTGILLQDLRVSIDSRKNIKVVALAAKDGPIRSSILFEGSMKYFGMPVPFKEHVYANFFEQAVNVPSKFTMDSMRSARYLMSLIKLPRAEVSVDFTGLKGGELTFDSVYNPEKPELVGVIDNEISPFEREMKKERLPGEWIYFSSNQGWDVFFSNQMNIQKGGIFDECLEGLNIRFLFEDNLCSVRDYERVPGAEPRLGALVEGLPLEALDIMKMLAKMDFSKAENLGDLLYEMKRMGEKGDLENLDIAVNSIVTRYKNKGKVSTKEELVEIFINDLNHITFKMDGVPRPVLNDLFSRALLSVLRDDLTEISCYDILLKGMELSAEAGIDLKNLRFLATDSTVWFPDSIGTSGPNGFAKEVRNPPEYAVKPFAAENYSQR